MTKTFSAIGLLIKLLIGALILIACVIKFGNDPWVNKLREHTRFFSQSDKNIFNDRQVGLKHAKHKAYLESLREKYSESPPLPKMVDVPAGSFSQGCFGNNCPDHLIAGDSALINAFQLAETETTLEQWDTCVAMGGCSHMPDNYGWGRGDLPALNISYTDVVEYVTWLNSITEGGYKIPEGDEWEYAARAGTNTLYPWGDNVPTCDMARLGSPSWVESREHECKTVGTWPVASKKANAWGLYDIIGNAAEWTQECAYVIGNITASSLPNKVRERLGDMLTENCSARMNKGGNLMTSAKTVNFWHARGYGADTRYNRVGFRLARSINHSSESLKK